MLEPLYVRNILDKIMYFLLLFNSIQLIRCVSSTDMDMYYQSWSSSGEKLSCQKCQRGSYKIGDCTSDWGLSECLPCPKGSYMPVLNTADRCIGCSQGCPGNTGATQTQTMGACTSTSDITCTCIDGYYEIDDGELCLPWTLCYPRTGVTQKATPKVDTVCEPCPEDTFSNNTSLTEPCKSCTACNATEVADPKSCADGKSDRICVLSRHIPEPVSEKRGRPLMSIVGFRVGIGIGAVIVIVGVLIVIARRQHVTLTTFTSNLRTCFGRIEERTTTTPKCTMELQIEEITVPLAIKVQKEGTDNGSTVVAVPEEEEPDAIPIGHHGEDSSHVHEQPRDLNLKKTTGVFACKYTLQSAQVEESRLWKYEVTSGSFINLRGSGIETIIDSQLRIQASAGVGKISCFGMEATCFRVGRNYVMTALHVVKQYASVCGINDVGYFHRAYVVFNYLDNSETIPNEDFFYLKPIASLRDDIPFQSEITDCVVLELEYNQYGRPMPYQFKEFSVPLHEKEFSLLTHSNSDVKHIDRVDVILNPHAQQTLDDIAFVQRESDALVRRNGLCTDQFKFQMDGENPDRLDNRNRILFHCRCTHGGSGSPGIIVSRGRVVVVTMLLRGFPDWFYDPNCVALRHFWQDAYRIEQGAHMISVAREMFVKNVALYNDVFGSDLS